MSEYTKGPWKAEYSALVGGSGWNVATYAEDEGTDLVASIRSSEGGYEQNAANAKLIAAAPDLLEALQLLQQAIYNARLLDVKKQFDLCVADSAASKAIAKATGKEPRALAVQP
jgi:hypothetical protein